MYTFLSPKTLEDARGFLKSYPNLKIIAGGTDLIIGLREGLFAPDAVMDIKQIPELAQIKQTDEGLEIGAAVTVSELLCSGHLSGAYNALKEAGLELANSLLRNRATLAGNICNASPGGDMLSASLVLDAWVETVTPEGGRKISLSDFFTGPKKHVLKPDEMVIKTVYPKHQGKSAYRKKKRIRGHDLAQVGVSGLLKGDGVLTLAFGACGPTPVLIGGFNTKTQSRAEILDAAMNGISPIGDVRASKEHRQEMARYLTEAVLDALEEVRK
ncbi:MAG: xanthine dehydrogenase family protein subunit M [Defluviitaleaceae bacterium]|nr:xanthine dehydrogenase family protein subunit M [Defluviitaleaceae bacterium]